MQSRIDLVADLGKGFGDWCMGDDAALLEIVSSASVACGFHAGDPRIMDATTRACATWPGTDGWLAWSPFVLTMPRRCAMLPWLST